MERAEARRLYFAMEGCLVLDDVDAIDIAVELFVLNGLLYICEAEHWHVGSQFAVTYDILTCRVDIASVG